MTDDHCVISLRAVGSLTEYDGAACS
jgi:hypothetical protein